MVLLLCRTCDDPSERWVKECPPIVIHPSRLHHRSHRVHSTESFDRDYAPHLEKAEDSSGVCKIATGLAPGGSRPDPGGQRVQRDLPSLLCLPGEKGR